MKSSRYAQQSLAARANSSSYALSARKLEQRLRELGGPGLGRGTAWATTQRSLGAHQQAVGVLTA